MADYHTVVCDACGREVAIPTVGSHGQLKWLSLATRKLEGFASRGLEGIGVEGTVFLPESQDERKDFCSLECLAHYVQMKQDAQGE